MNRNPLLAAIQEVLNDSGTALKHVAFLFTDNTKPDLVK
jgi:hypothetical protein